MQRIIQLLMILYFPILLHSNPLPTLIDKNILDNENIFLQFKVEKLKPYEELSKNIILNKNIKGCFIEFIPHKTSFIKRYKARRRAINSLRYSNDDKNPYYYIPSSKVKYLGLSFATILSANLIGTGIGYIADPNGKLKHFKSNYLNNVRSGPTIYTGKQYIEDLYTPYTNALFYVQARSAGYNWGLSTLYTIALNTFIGEYGVKAVYKKPSWTNLVLAPALGSLLGELFFRGIRHIQDNYNTLWGSKVMGEIALFLFDPVGSIIKNSGLAKLSGINNLNNMDSQITINGIILKFKY